MANHHPNSEALVPPSAGHRGDDDTTGPRALDDRCSEITDAIDELRQLIARADALASTTDEQFCRVVVLREGDDRRGFKRLAHLVELTAIAVMSASDASNKLIAAVEHTLPTKRP